MLLSCLACLPCSWQYPLTCARSKTTIYFHLLYLSACSYMGTEMRTGEAARWGAFVPLLLLLLMFVTLRGFVLPKRSLLFGFLLGYGPLPSTREVTYMGHRHATNRDAYLERFHVQGFRHLRHNAVI